MAEGLVAGPKEFCCPFYLAFRQHRACSSFAVAAHTIYHNQELSTLYKLLSKGKFQTRLDVPWDTETDYMGNWFRVFYPAQARPGHRPFLGGLNPTQAVFQNGRPNAEPDAR